MSATISRNVVRVEVSPCAERDGSTAVVTADEAEFFTVYTRERQDNGDELAFAHCDATSLANAILDATDLLRAFPTEVPVVYMDAEGSHEVTPL